jgi:uncharacterized protein YjbI with pentapeptide repeats
MRDKKRLSLIIMLIAILIMIYSCGSSDSNKIQTSEVALHEHAFTDYPNLHAQFSHVTVLEFEHAQESNVHEKDSGNPGVDMIPFTAPLGKNLTFKFEDIGNGNHYAILCNENEEEVARIDANGTPVTVQLLNGKYKLYLYNMENETFPLFLQPVTADVESNRQSSVNLDQLVFFLLTHHCPQPQCDLSNAFLPFAILPSADLSTANLSHANLSYANLSYANLSYANLKNANLSHANLNTANLQYANLSYANLFGANLDWAQTGGALFYGATWVDGHKCDETQSIHFCH